MNLQPHDTLPGRQDACATISRRQFLRLALGAAGAAATIHCTTWKGAGGAECHWALFSDTHIKGIAEVAVPKKHFYFMPSAQLERACGEALAARPDGLIVTGDLARLTGDLDDYKKLHELLAPAVAAMPLFMAMGNHDNREHYAQVFTGAVPGKQAVPGHHVIVIEQGPVRFVVLDSCQKPNVTQGLLGEAQLAWLEKFLAGADERPTLICLHHVPDREEKDFADGAKLREIVKPSRKVKAIIYGHSHEYRFGDLDGIHLINLPALGYSFNLKEPVGWVDAELTGREGAFTLRVIAGPKDQDGKTQRLAWRG